MKRNSCAWLLLSACLLACPGALGQEARLALTPPLGDALPLEDAPDGVRLKFPILLNSHAVLNPNALLRLVYVDPNAGLRLHSSEAPGPAFQGGSLHQHPGGFQKPVTGDGLGGAAVSGDGFGPEGGIDKKLLAQEVGAEVWMQAQLFRDALNEAADLGTMVVYSVPGKPKPLSAEVDLPDGMLLGLMNQHVTVLALSADSQAGQAGLQPQDEIRSINGQAAPGSLDAFMQLYRDITRQAQKAGQPYSFDVWRPAESKLVTIQVGAPPSIPSMF